MIAEAIRKVRETPFSEHKRGSEARFIHLWDNWGLKFFWDDSLRDMTYRKQKRAASHGLAPILGEKIDFTIEKNEHFGYLTKTVKTVKDKIYESEGLADNFDFDDWTYEIYSREMKSLPEYQLLRDGMIKIGFRVADLHWANVGYDEHGRFLCIDFDLA